MTIGGSTSTFNFLGLTFNLGNIISVTIACVIVLALVFALSRHLTMKPGKAQNVLEYAVDFTNGIVNSSVSGEAAKSLGLWGFSLFMFLLVANLQGLFLHVDISGITFVKSPTSDPVVTMTLSLMTLTLAQFLGIRTLGYKGHFENYLKPFWPFIIVNLFEEFTNFLTLGLRLFGNILSGEMLLSMITSMAMNGGPKMWIAAFPLELAWQGFSVFIGCIQAYVFVVLSSVYISRKIELED
ncbi:MAG: F0F1 ATP synthase subunit A [Lentilactobacillus diolivorans]|nr:F0F1 ATP synthase subunit A [Lentilactobacillus diolivorans]MCH4164675.1 F0F1 ATP synthase subunit A [Lentilactobacillus diolivorans]MDH5106603.1 F0F1 ATP synthase subunit A [Lentilactobacillus diolivorans]RRG04461.1 MAG: F0F1 ATP synthase subunit A [Lactobacillus sp.]GEP22522.1 ATP synthase subunit a [Lentilactobacillus diolivorans]